jgi:Electron transfer flavoprotein, alpha subunit
MLSHREIQQNLWKKAVQERFSLLKILTGDSVADLIAEKMKAGEYTHAFFASTVNGRDVAGLVSGKTGMKAVAEINSLVLDGNTVKTKRFFYGGKSIVEEESDAKIFTFVTWHIRSFPGRHCFTG